MLGNITLVQPLERLYNSTFQKGWDKTLDKIRLTSPGDLEEMDQHIKKLENLYEMSGLKKISTSLGTYPDEYAQRIKQFRTGLCETVASKFRTVTRQIERHIGDPASFEEFEKERQDFDEAITMFRMLRAYYKRWKLYTNDYQYAGQRYDFEYEQKRMANILARKRMTLMKHHNEVAGVVDYKKKLGVLEEISGEISKLHDWYKDQYLNVDGRNPSWIGTEEITEENPWMPVHFLDEDPDIAPLERFRIIPTKHELKDVNRLFNRFVEFYREHDLIQLNELGVLEDFAKFKDYSANFSLYSEDTDERLKAGLMEQMMNIHKVSRDAKERFNLKGHTEKMFDNSFAMYFAPIDEVYEILKRGYICSEHSMHHRLTGKHFDSLIFNVDADIKDGDVGFIFPLTKVIDGQRFYQVSYNPLVKDGLSESNTDIHVFSRHQSRPINIDIRKGVFVAPRNKIMTYTVDGKTVKETTQEYFSKFFTALAQQGSDWFEASRLQNWLSRHCVFYDDNTRSELLNMLRDKDFVHIINRFTNKNYDNLALTPLPGTLVPTEYYVTHKFERIPEHYKDVLGSDTFNLTLFKWEREEE